MSLESLYDAVVAGCVAIPQHGAFAAEYGKFGLTIAVGVNRTYFQFTDDVLFDFLCPSPPAVFSFNVYEKISPDVSATDPIFSFGCFLTTCASPGFALNTSKWLVGTFTAYHFFGRPDHHIDWLHITNLHSPTGSIGIVRTGVPLP